MPRLPLLLVTAMACIASAACGRQATAEPSSCVEEAKTLLNQRGIAIKAKVEAIQTRFPEPTGSLEETSAFADLMSETEIWENRIRVAVQRCPEAAAMVKQRAREVPIRVVRP
ncbi:MAG: hypothetical protein H6918_03230 [Sphingomonadaceae bacterium]|nr:hypothetical protein [Sphingomonadaceae bacterium]